MTKAASSRANRIESAMVLAAGFGTRMAPLTDDRPKPLIKLAGKTLLDWTIERLTAARIDRIIVNTHYKADQIEEHCRKREEITLSHEPVIQESGGGVRDALALLGPHPFFVANADTVWLDGATPATMRLAHAWRSEEMDILLLLTPVTSAYGYDGPGDYYYSEEGKPMHRGERLTAPFAFSGLQILHPRIFKNAPDGPFSLRDLYHQAQKRNRLSAITHDGEWHHVGTVDALKKSEDAILAGLSRAKTR